MCGDMRLERLALEVAGKSLRARGDSEPFEKDALRGQARRAGAGRRHSRAPRNPHGRSGRPCRGRRAGVRSRGAAPPGGCRRGCASRRNRRSAPAPPCAAMRAPIAVDDGARRGRRSRRCRRRGCPPAGGPARRGRGRRSARRSACRPRQADHALAPAAPVAQELADREGVEEFVGDEEQRRFGQVRTLSCHVGA